MSASRASRVTAAIVTVVICGAVAGLGWWLASTGGRDQSSSLRDDSTAATASPAPTESPTVVPWVDRPAEPPPPPQPPEAPAMQFGKCQADQLTAHGLLSGAAAGNVVTRIELTNTSSSPCTLAGFPTSFVGVRADGTQVQLDPGHGTFFDGEGYWPANLQHGDSAWLTIGTSDVCDALNRRDPKTDPYAGEVVGLPGGGTVTADAEFDPSCGLDVSELGVPAQPPPEPDAYPGLKLSIDRPDTAPAGSVMHFTITLTNTTNDAVDLTPCPVYTQGVFTTRAHTASYELNCDEVDSIPAGGAVTWAMQLDVPDGPGMAKFGWGIPAGGYFAGDVLTIT